MRKLLVLLTCAALLSSGCNRAQQVTPITKNPTPMTITSPAFEANGLIPAKYTCEGENINPPLEFHNVPAGTATLVLLMDDPDVPKNLKPDGVFDHWVVYNISPETKGLAENETNFVIPTAQGKNGKGEAKYTGPCPPDREHRYFFKLYALSEGFELNTPPTKDEVKSLMQNRIIEQAELIGRYDKQTR